MITKSEMAFKRSFAVLGILLMTFSPTALGQSNSKQMNDAVIEQAEDAILANSISAVLHTAAAGVCLAACYSANIGAGACTVSTLSAAGLDIVSAATLQKSADAIVGSVTFAGVGALATLQSQSARSGVTAANEAAAKAAESAKAAEEASKKAAEEGADEATKKAAEEASTKAAEDKAASEAADKESDSSSCVIPVITETLQVVMKGAMIASAIQTKKDAKANSNALSRRRGQTRVRTADEDTGEADAPPSDAPGGTDTAEVAFGSDDIGDERGCGRERQSGSGREFIQCAVARGVSIPPALQSVNLNDPSIDRQIGELIKALPEDMSDNSGLASTLSAATGGQADAAGLKGTLDSIQADLEKEGAFAKYAEANGSTYAGGGGGGSSSSSGGLDFGSLIKDTMKGFGGLLGANGEKAKKKKKGVFELVYKKMTPEQVAKNKDLSLFDRIEFRYGKNRTNLRTVPFASAYNQAIIRSANSKGPSARAKRQPAAAQSRF